MFFKKRAFTLIEAAVGAALFLLVIGIAMGMFSQAPKDEAHLSKKLDLYAEARRAYFDMTEEMKLGTEILQPSINGSTPFILFTNVTYEIVGYYLRKSPKDPKKRELCRVNFNEKDAKPVVLCDKIQELRFTRKGRREVAVRMSLSDKNLAKPNPKAKSNAMAMFNSITLRNTLNAM